MKKQKIIILIILFLFLFMSIKKLLLVVFCPTLFDMSHGIPLWIFEQSLRWDISLLAKIFSIPLFLFFLGNKTTKYAFALSISLSFFLLTIELIDWIFIIKANERNIPFLFTLLSSGAALFLFFKISKKTEKEDQKIKINICKILFFSFFSWILICGFTPLSGPLSLKRITKVCFTLEEFSFVQSGISSLLYKNEIKKIKFND